MMLSYAVRLEPDDNDTLLVTCPDLPGVVTYGAYRDDALRHARDAIETWLAGLIDDGLDVPAPRHEPAGADEASVRIPMLAALKVELYRTLHAAGITRAELARASDGTASRSIGCSG